MSSCTHVRPVVAMTAVGLGKSMAVVVAVADIVDMVAVDIGTFEAAAAAVDTPYIPNTPSYLRKI